MSGRLGGLAGVTLRTGILDGEDRILGDGAGVISAPVVELCRVLSKEVAIRGRNQSSSSESGGVSG
jgi:hypothetical protein